jgi:hypothetical protein
LARLPTRLARLPRVTVLTVVANPYKTRTNFKVATKVAKSVRNGGGEHYTP